MNKVCSALLPASRTWINCETARFRRPRLAQGILWYSSGAGGVPMRFEMCRSTTPFFPTVICFSTVCYRLADTFFAYKLSYRLSGNGMSPLARRERHDISPKSRDCALARAHADL